MSVETKIQEKLTAKEASFDTLVDELVVLANKAEDLDGDKFNADTLSNFEAIIVTATKAGVLANECGLLRNLQKEITKTAPKPVTAPKKTVTPGNHRMFHNG